MSADAGAVDFQKVDEELLSGRLWRAKEMLQGRLTQPLFDELLLEKYGNVLLLMGDRLEAGRYLFASGKRNPEYKNAIELFLSRHENADIEQLISEMPLMVRRHRDVLSSILSSSDFAEHGYPEAVRAALSETTLRPERQVPATPARLKFLLIVIGLGIAAVFLTGLYVILRFLISATLGS